MSEMTLSQALRHSKKLKGKIGELSSRAVQSVSHRVSAPPAFEFGATFESLESHRTELVDLEARIAVTNATTTFDFDGKTRTLTWAVRRLQELKSSIAWLKTLPVRAHETTTEQELQYLSGNHTNVDVPWTCDLPEAKRSEKVDSEQTAFDRLNDAVERKNHATVLVA